MDATLAQMMDLNWWTIDRMIIGVFAFGWLLWAGRTFIRS